MSKLWNVNIERLEPLYRPGDPPAMATGTSKDSEAIFQTLVAGLTAPMEERLDILSAAEKALEMVNDSDEFFERYALDLLETLGPYLTMGTPPIQQDDDGNKIALLSENAEKMHEVRKKAREIFAKVAQHLQHKEVAIFTKERLSLVDWKRFSTDLDYATETTLVISSYMGHFVKVLAEEISELKPWIVADMVYMGATWSGQLICAIESILKAYASWGRRDRYQAIPHLPAHRCLQADEQWNAVLHTLGEMLLSLVQLFAQIAITRQEKDGDVLGLLNPKSEDLGRDTIGMKLLYLSQYLLLEIFDKMIGNMDLDLLSAYNAFYPWEKYSINRPFEPVKKKADIVPRPDMFMFVNDCMDTACAARLTYENALRLRSMLVRPLWDDQEHPEEEDKNDREMVNSNLYPLSNDGIAMFLALSICDSYVFSLATEQPGHRLMPGVIPVLWMARHCLGLTLNVLYTDSVTVPRVDKAMTILVYLAQHVEGVKVGIEMLVDMPLYGLRKTLGNPSEKFDLSDGIQVMCRTATRCPHPTMRLAVYQLLSKFLDMCVPEAQVMVIYEITQGEKSSPVFEAAIRLLKDRIVYAFDNKEDRPHAMYRSAVVTDKFFEVIFRKPAMEDMMALTGYYMQALNMYRFLLMRDKENETGVWSEDKIAWTYKAFLNPLKSLIKTCKERGGDEADRDLQMELLEMALDAINDITGSAKK